MDVCVPLASQGERKDEEGDHLRCVVCDGAKVASDFGFLVGGEALLDGIVLG